MGKLDLKILVVCLLIVFLTAGIGSLFTSGNVESQWYLENKPSFTPPNWIFGPVWTILYVLIAVSLYFTWKKANKNQKKKVRVLFGINLIANSIWSLLFFKLQNPFLALLDIILILTTIIMMILTTKKIDKRSAQLLVPYLIWVCFATFLNLSFII